MKCHGNSPASLWDDGTPYNSSALTLHQDCQRNKCLYLKRDGRNDRVKRHDCDGDKKTLCTISTSTGKWLFIITIYNIFIALYNSKHVL